MSIQDCLKNACDSVRADSITAQAAATQAKAARDNLPLDVDGSKTLTYREEMPSNTDLNSKTTTGLYGQTSNSQATLELNYPTTLAGMLEVTTSGLITFQRYSTHSVDRVYVRSLYDGIWTKWKQIATTESLNNLMFYSVYVNSDTGDDANLGTSSEPLKTIGEAINRSPYGSSITIFLKGANSHLVTQTHYISGHTVIFSGDGNTTIEMNGGIFNNDRGNALVYLYKCTFKTEPSSETSAFYSIAGRIDVYAYSSSIQLLTGHFLVGYTSLSTLGLFLSNSTIQRSSGTARLASGYYVPIDFSISASTISGNTADYKDLVYIQHRNASGDVINIQSPNSFD